METPKPIRKKKAAVEATPVVQEETALAAQPAKIVVQEGDPEAQLEFAGKAAKALMKVVNSKPNPVMIRGKRYLEYGDWQTLARFFGATAAIEWTKPIERNGKLLGYEAKATVLHNGVVISSAEAMCTIEERTWSTRDEFAIRSMAQTRAAAKALRNAYGWVAELAGYSSTPVEEMDGVPRDTAPARPPAAPAVNAIGQKKQLVVRLMKALDYDVMEMEKTEAHEAVLKLTGLDMNDANLEEIVTRLNVLVSEQVKVNKTPEESFMDSLPDINEPENA